MEEAAAKVTKDVAIDFALFLNSNPSKHQGLDDAVDYQAMFKEYRETSEPIRERLKKEMKTRVQVNKDGKIACPKCHL